MITQVLVPMDDSEMGQRALEYALENHPDADITVLHVVGGPSSMGAAATALALQEDLEGAAEEQAETVFERAEDLAQRFDKEITTELQLGNPARVILNTAADFDVVVIGTHSGSLADRLFVGNIARKVFRGSPVPVVTVR